MKYTRSSFTRRLTKSAVSPTAWMSRLRKRARASSSDSLTPEDTLSRMLSNEGSISSAFPHLFQDASPGPLSPRRPGQGDRKRHALALPVVQPDPPPLVVQ